MMAEAGAWGVVRESFKTPVLASQYLLHSLIGLYYQALILQFIIAIIIYLPLSIVSDT